MAWQNYTPHPIVRRHRQIPPQLFLSASSRPGQNQAFQMIWLASLRCQTRLFAIRRKASLQENSSKESCRHFLVQTYADNSGTGPCSVSFHYNLRTRGTPERVSPSTVIAHTIASARSG